MNTIIVGKEARQKEYLQKIVAVKSSSEVEACRCCGNRQLSGDQVSLDVHHLTPSSRRPEECP